MSDEIAEPPVASPSSAAATRWTPALIVVGVVIAAAIFVLVVLAGLGSSSTVVRWVPADTVAYAEIRLDLPGDQEANLGAFLSHFPGFDDTARLSDKLAELADRIIGAGSGGGLDYSTQVAPWFGGQLGLAAGPANLGTTDEAAGLVVMSVTDEAQAAAWADRVLGPATASENQDGVTVDISERGPKDVAWAVTGGVLLIGDPASVRAAIDTGGSSEFASRDDVTAARGEVGPDQIVFWFADTAVIAGRLGEVLPGLSLPVPDVDSSRLPEWAAGGIRFEPEMAIATSVVPHTHDTAIANTPSEIPSRVPASTVILLDAHDVGPRLAEALGSLGSTDELGSLDGALRLLGGQEGLVGWISEAAIVLDAGANGPTGGVVAISSDVQASAGLFTQLEIAARLTGGEVSEAESNGTQIVTVELSGLDGLLGSGLGANLPALPIEGSISLSWATSGDLVVIGTSPEFVEGVLATTSDTSLASTATFDELLDEAGRSNVALGWIDIGSALELADDTAIGAADLLDRGDTAVYLAPLEAGLGTFQVDAQADRSTFVLSVAEPS